MKQRNKKLWNKVISWMLVVSMIYGISSSSLPVVVAQDTNTTPTTYTVTMEEATEALLLSKEACTKSPVTIQYTVQSANAKGWSDAEKDNYGVIATTDSEGDYSGAKGSMRTHAQQNFLYPGYTYKYVISINPETGLVEVESYQNGSKVDKFYASGYCRTEGDGNTTSDYFGFYLDASDSPRTAVLKDVICMDADGNSLGLYSNSKNVVVEADVADEHPVTYTVSLNNVTEMTLFSEKAAEGPVTIEYTVESSNAGWNDLGRNSWTVISQTDPTAEYTDEHGSKCGTKQQENFLFPTYTYKYTVQMDSEVGKISAVEQDVTDAIGESWSQTTKFAPTSSGSGSTDPTYVALVFTSNADGSNGTKTAVLKNVTMVDEKGRNLGVQSFSEGVTVEKDVAKQPVTYKVTMNQLQTSETVFLYNEIASTNSPITIQYTVQESNALADRGVDLAKYNLAATTDPEARVDQNYWSGKGSAIIQDYENFLRKGNIYTYEVTLNSENKIEVDYYLNGSKVTDKFSSAPQGNGNAASCYFGLAMYSLQGERSVTLTNFSIVDADGNNLGVKCTNSNVTIVEEVPTTIMEEHDLDVYRRDREASYLEPQKVGYEFAGWYTDLDGTKVLDNDVYIGKAYAKFVDAKVMDVKAQLATDKNTNETYNIRFVTTVDSEKYDKVGFKIEIPDISYTYTTEETVVYQALIAETGNGSYDEITPDSFSSISQYFTAVIVEGIPEAYFGSAITVTPYWVTQDGTTVWANAVSKTVNEGIAANQ